VKTIKIAVLLISISVIISGCGKKEESIKNETVKKDTSSQKTKEPDKKPDSNEYMTKSGKVFLINVNKSSESLADIIVTGKGFVFKNDTVKFRETNPFEKAFVADIDGNGFEDLFIITRSAGSGSQGEILGVASNNDKSYSIISVEEIKKADMKSGKMFEGYMGHDSIYTEKEKLVREFPVYKSSDTNNNPTGGKRKVFYKLSPGETSYQLKVSGKEDVK